MTATRTNMGPLDEAAGEILNQQRNSEAATTDPATNDNGRGANPLDVDPNTIKINTKSIEEALAPFIVPEEEQPSRAGEFWNNQVGGHDKRFLTKADTKNAVVLGTLKWLAAGGPAYAVTEMLGGMLSHLNSIQLFSVFNGTMPFTANHIATPMLFGGAFYAFQKFDTLILSGMRETKTLKDIFRRQGPNGAVAESDTRTSPLQYAFRAAMTTASIAVTVPALLVSSAKSTINDRIMPPIIEHNQEVMVKHQTALAAHDARLADAQAKKQEIQAKMGAGAAGVYTDSEQREIEALSEQIARITRQMGEMRTDITEKEAERDKSQADMEDERAGILPGTDAGEGPRYRAAKFRRDTAVREIERLEQTIRDLDRERGEARDRYAAIQAIAQTRFDGGSYQGILGNQLAEIEARITELERQREWLADLDQRTREDSYYQHEPSLGEELKAYWDYAENENPFEYVKAGALSTLFAILELGMLFGAAGFSVTSGERRAMLARIALQMRDEDVMQQLQDVAALRKARRDEASAARTHAQEQGDLGRTHQKNQLKLQREFEKQEGELDREIQKAIAERDRGLRNKRSEIQVRVSGKALDAQSMTEETVIDSRRELLDSVLKTVIEDPKTAEAIRTKMLEALLKQEGPLIARGIQGAATLALDALVQERLQKMTRNGDELNVDSPISPHLAKRAAADDPSTRRGSRAENILDRALL